MRATHLAPALLTASAAWALVAPRSPHIEDRPASSFDSQPDACVLASYYGTYGGASASQDELFFPTTECLRRILPAGEAAVAWGVEPRREGYRLVWVGPAGVDPSLIPPEERDLAGSWNNIKSRAANLVQSAPAGSEQRPFAANKESDEIQLFHQTESSLLLHVPLHLLGQLDTLLPAHLVPVALPEEAYGFWPTVKSDLVENIANLTKHLKFDPKIDSILSEGVELGTIRRAVRWLTGEAPSGWESRHAFTQGAVDAAAWIKDKVETLGFTCEYFPFLEGFSPDVICDHPSLTNSSEIVLLSAHYDSRGSFGQTRAPGGNDDGSGSGQLLGIVEAIADQKIRFEKQLRVAFFSGEEQGLYGSHAYAKHMYESNATILLHIQADMLGYHAPGEPLQLALPESIGLDEAAYLVGNVSQLYSPELVVGRTPACCSDHQSFVSYGFPATQVYERNGWIVDPMYHNSGDLSQREGYDFEQIVAIAKVVLATAMTVAGWQAEGSS